MCYLISKNLGVSTYLLLFNSDDSIVVTKNTLFLPFQIYEIVFFIDLQHVVYLEKISCALERMCVLHLLDVMFYKCQIGQFVRCCSDLLYPYWFFFYWSFYQFLTEVHENFHLVLPVVCLNVLRSSLTRYSVDKWRLLSLWIVLSPCVSCDSVRDLTCLTERSSPHLLILSGISFSILFLSPFVCVYILKGIPYNQPLVGLAFFSAWVWQYLLSVGFF